MHIRAPPRHSSAPLPDNESPPSKQFASPLAPPAPSPSSRKAPARESAPEASTPAVPTSRRSHKTPKTQSNFLPRTAAHSAQQLRHRDRRRQSQAHPASPSIPPQTPLAALGSRLPRMPQPPPLHERRNLHRRKHPHHPQQNQNTAEHHAIKNPASQSPTCHEFPQAHTAAAGRSTQTPAHSA